MSNNKDIYLISLFRNIVSIFMNAAKSYERSAQIFEEQIRKLCAQKADRDRDRVLYDNLDILNNIVVLRKKANMYRFISEILDRSINLLVINKEFIHKNIKIIERIARKEIGTEEATNHILKILKNILSIDIQKDEHTTPSMHDIQILFKSLCVS